jgi:hypothetical protein
MIAQSEAIKSLPSIPGYRWMPMGELWFALMAQYDDISRNGHEIREWCGGWRVQKQFYTYCETLDDAIAFFLSGEV